MWQLSADSPEHPRARFQLQAPLTVRLLQAELRKMQERHRRSSSDQDRVAQLLEEISLVDRMIHELMAQGEAAVAWQLTQAGSQQSVRQWNPTDPGPAGPGRLWVPSQDDILTPLLQVNSAAYLPTTGAQATWPDGPSMERSMSGLDSQSEPETEDVKTIKSHLQDLQKEDPDAVIITRGISKLGFSSGSHLREYFGKYGEVKHVYVSHSGLKSKRQGTFRMRASSLGFVVMFSRDAASQIVADGPQHCIDRVNVKVQAFHRVSNSPSDDASSSAGMQAPARLAREVDGTETPERGAMPLMASLVRFSEHDLRTALPSCYEE